MSNPLDDMTMETLSAISKAQTTGILESTGAYSYDLTGIVRLIPVVVPLRTLLAREASPNGSPFAIWRAFLDVTSSQPRATPGFDYAGNEVIFKEQDFQAKYKPIALANIVTQDAVDVAKGLYDPYAEGTFQTLNLTMIAEDRLLFGGQDFVLAQPGTITATPSTTGGTIAASTTNQIAVAARTGSGYFYGGNSQGRATGTITTTGATSSIAASIAAVKGAVAYDWFYSSNSGTTYFYAGTTTVASFTFLSTLAANATVGNIALPDLSTVLPTLNVAADNGSCPLDGGSNPVETNGLLASLTGDYNGSGQFVTAGTGTANGAGWVDNGGAALTLSGSNIAAINNMFQLIWNKVKCSPTAIMMNSINATEVSLLILSSPAATLYLQTAADGKTGIVGGGRVGALINTPAGGVIVPIEVHPSVPPGTMIFRTDRVPFPQANISSTLAVRTLRDYSQFDYPAARVAGTLGGGPRKEFEIRSVQTLINRAPVAMAVLSNFS